MNIEERIENLTIALGDNMYELNGSVEEYEEILHRSENILNLNRKVEYLTKQLHDHNAVEFLPFARYENGFQCPICLGTNTWDNDNLAGCVDCNVCLTTNC